MDNKIINYFVLCESVIKSTDGRYSLINALDSMQSVLPARIYKLSIALSLKNHGLLKLLGEKKEADLVVDFIDPDGETFRGFRMSLAKAELSSDELKNIVTELDLTQQDGITFEKPGTYKIDLTFSGKKFASKEVDIAQLEDEE